MRGLSVLLALVFLVACRVSGAEKEWQRITGTIDEVHRDDSTLVRVVTPTRESYWFKVYFVARRSVQVDGKKVDLRQHYTRANSRLKGQQVEVTTRFAQARLSQQLPAANLAFLKLATPDRDSRLSDVAAVLLWHDCATDNGPRVTPPDVPLPQYWASLEAARDRRSQ